MLREQLVATLDLTSRALAGNSLIPVLQCFCFNKTNVKASNDTLAIVAPCETGLELAVHGQTLLRLLQASHTDKVDFKLDGTDLVIKTGRSTFKLPWFPEDDFLFEEPKGPWQLGMKLDRHALQGLEACLRTSSRDQSQQALMGIALVSKPKAKHLSFFSCDGDAVSKYDLPDTKVSGEADLVMPNAFCEAVLKVVADTEGGEGTLSLGKEWAMAAFQNGYKVYGRLIRGDRPLGELCEQLIKQTLKTDPAFIAVPEELGHALARARVIADLESAPTTLTVVEQGCFMALHTQTHMGVVRDSIRFDKHPDVQATVSAEKVQAAISLCNEIAILPNCSVHRLGFTLLQVVSTM